jgi:hypothetical protein
MVQPVPRNANPRAIAARCCNAALAPPERRHGIAEDGLDGLEKIVGTLNDISTAAL